MGEDTTLNSLGVPVCNVCNVSCPLSDALNEELWISSEHEKEKGGTSLWFVFALGPICNG